MLTLLNLFLERVLSGRTRAVVFFSSRITRLLSGILYWIILFIFVTAALKTAGLTGVATWLERLVDFLPGIVTGGLIILLGYVFAGLVRDVTLAAAHSAEFTEAVVISRLAQVITFITALIIGLDQIGIDVTFLTTMLGVSSAALLFGFTLAFGLGARTLVSNLIAAHHLRDVLEPGQDIRIGEWEGTVLEVSATAVILDTQEGRTSVPAKLYQEQAVVMLLADAAHE
jgi:small-conductance mechanosensitive channel